VRRDTCTEETLRRQLAHVPEVSLDTNVDVSKQLVAMAGTASASPYPGPMILLPWRADLRGLSFLKDPDCRIGKEAAENLHILAPALHESVIEAAIVHPDPVHPDLSRPDPEPLRKDLMNSATKDKWRKADAIPTLLQILQTESGPVRLLLVEFLREMDDPRATAALAIRALVDLSPEVRRAAVSALADRAAEDYRDLLLAGFRHPWPPVAEHAAEALAALQDRASVPALVSLLDRPAPSQPWSSLEGSRRTFVVRELVRVNHFRNCLLCHPPSTSETDLVRAQVPSTTKPFDPSGAYEQDKEGVLVHADVTYLRPDFSIVQPVSNPPSGWPTFQRFDYLTRTRLLDAAEARRLASDSDRVTVEYRGNVLFTLRQLTGANAGDKAADWRTWLGTADFSPKNEGRRSGIIGDWKQFFLDEPLAERAPALDARP
jgi:hypothetical protein